MQRRLIQCALTLTGALAIVGTSASESQAFWWSRCCYRPVYYRPVFYRPIYTAYAPSCYSSCSPCGTGCYNPCGSFCNPCGYSCGSGGCGIACGPGGCTIDGGAAGAAGSGGDDRLDPEPRTFGDDPPPVDDGFRGRSPDNDLTPEDDRYNRDALKPNLDAPESTMPKQPAPMTDPEADVVPADPEVESPEPMALQLDNAITWKPRTSRSRLQIRASFANPVVVRTKVDPNKNWVPVADQELRLVSK